MLNKKALSATAGAPKVFVEDVFSCFLYTGNGSTQTITNGIDLAGKGGLVWIKRRDATGDHTLTDTARGASNVLYSNSNVAQSTDTQAGAYSYLSNGFDVYSASGFGTSNRTGATYASWTFRKAEKFFDVVTYTGNGSVRTIAHNLGSVPGCIIVKKTSGVDNWFVQHRSLGATKYIALNDADIAYTNSQLWNNTDPTSSVFTLGTNSGVNQSGATYVAYLFAHNAGGFGDAGDQNVISCGSFTSAAGGSATLTLNYEPQWILFKRTDSIGDWFMFDNMRGMFAQASLGTSLYSNTSGAEVSAATRAPFVTSTGLTWDGSTNTLDASATYIYIAIRRGPMKTPETGTSVFNPVVYTGTNVDNRLINTTIAPDMVMIRQRDDSVVDGVYVGNRLTGDEYLLTGTTDAAASDLDSFMTPTSGYGNAFSAMNGVGVGNDATRKFNANTTSNNHVIWAFKRAPKFFDVVCYTGDGTTNRSISHNLGVAPELIILKIRSTTGNWFAYVPSGNIRMALNVVNASPVFSGGLSGTTPTSTTFSLGNDTDVNANASTYIAYLFASLTGVSKVGSYTGNGSTTGPTVTTGFSPRYLLIKSISTSGEWVVYDTARGLGSGNEPTILLATASAEYSGNYISPSSTGFQLVSNAGDINTNNQTYLYLAIA